MVSHRQEGYGYLLPNNNNPKKVVLSVKGKYIRETDKAVLFRVTHVRDIELDEPKTSWFPLSQITQMKHSTNPEHALEEEDTLMISEWIAKQKELI